MTQLRSSAVAWVNGLEIAFQLNSAMTWRLASTHLDRTIFIHKILKFTSYAKNRNLNQFSTHVVSSSL